MVFTRICNKQPRRSFKFIMANKKQETRSANIPANPGTSALKSRLYQYFRLSSSLLFAALVARWAVLFPLVGSKFLPGGIHEFLCYLMLYAGFFEIVWTYAFRGFKRTLLSRTLLKDVSFLYWVGILHFYDDYEHALVLKNISYSTFIVTLGLSQTYCHWCKLFKSPSKNRNTILWKIDTFLTLPILYLSEFYLLLLNVQTPNFHSYHWLEIVNKVVLIIFIPISLHAFRKQLSLY